MSKMRMSPISLSPTYYNTTKRSKRFFHLTCRDRNIIGLQSELLGLRQRGRAQFFNTYWGQTRQWGPSIFTIRIQVDCMGLLNIAKTLNARQRPCRQRP